MKIAIITRSMLGGGVERVISNLLKYFISAGHECILIIYESSVSCYSIPEGCTVYSAGDKFGGKISRYRYIAGLLKEEKPAVAFIIPEEVGIYTLAFTLFSPHPPIVISEANDPARLPERKPARILRRLLYPLASGFIFQTEGAKNYFPENIRKKGIVLYNPLDLSQLPLPFSGEREKTVVTGGRLSEQKNHELLIRAFAKFRETHSDYRLIIYGEGNLRPQLEALAGELLPREAWSLPGRSDTLFEDMLSAGIFVLSSDYEGVPNVLGEAIALGLPTVACDCPPGGCSKLIRDGYNGLLVPCGNADALASAMSRIADDKELAVRLSSHWQEMRELHDSEKVSAQWLEFILSFAKEK